MSGAIIRDALIMIEQASLKEFSMLYSDAESKGLEFGT